MVLETAGASTTCASLEDGVETTDSRIPQDPSGIEGKKEDEKNGEVVNRVERIDADRFQVQALADHLEGTVPPGRHLQVDLVRLA